MKSDADTNHAYSYKCCIKCLKSVIINMATVRIFVLFATNLPENSINIIFKAVAELNIVNLPMK